jgi:predicted RNase H-like nuclease (RuvC/YqgF family)
MSLILVGWGPTNNRELRVVIRDVTKENDILKSEVRDMHRSMEQLLLSTKHAKYDEMELENRKLKKSVGELENMVIQLQTSVGVSSNRRRSRKRWRGRMSN